eukprot:m.117258 g.117258  ORF g.117258 m.117258 type:complete len:74 (-) comp9204_c1_seq3:3367-3588(-)
MPGKPFSAKAKKEQLKAKRQRKREEPHMFGEDTLRHRQTVVVDMNPQPQPGGGGRNPNKCVHIHLRGQVLAHS